MQNELAAERIRLHDIARQLQAERHSIAEMRVQVARERSLTSRPPMGSSGSAAPRAPVLPVPESRHIPFVTKPSMTPAGHVPFTRKFDKEDDLIKSVDALLINTAVQATRGSPAGFPFPTSPVTGDGPAHTRSGT